VVVALLNGSEGMITLLVPPYMDGLGFAPTAVGLLVSAYGVACLASRLPAGALYRGERAKTLLCSSLVAVALISMVYPLATEAWSLLLVRALHGLAYGLATTINLALFIDSLPPTAARHHAMGYFMGALGGGFTLGQALGGFAADWYGYGWAFPPSWACRSSIPRHPAHRALPRAHPRAAAPAAYGAGCARSARPASRRSPSSAFS
jgi:MFS family permease